MKRKSLTILCALCLLLSAGSAVQAAENPDEEIMMPPSVDAGMADVNVVAGEEPATDPPAEGVAAIGMDNDIVLVGLAYGDGVLDGANLSNKEGTGFRFGYLDEERAFWQVGYTGETSISVVKTQNVWYGLDPAYSSSLKSYSDSLTSDVAVGCWHVQIPTEAALSSFEEALAFAQGFGGFPAWIEGSWQARLGAFTTREEAQATADAVGGVVAGTSTYGVSVVKTGSSIILFQMDGGADLPLTVRPGLDDSVKTVTNYRGSRYYGMFQFRRVGGKDLTVINALDLDDYTNCVITQEMSASWPLEALKAQAVCARTYWEYHKNKHSSYGFDLCSTTDCQAYPGMGSVTERTTQVIQETANQRIWYEGKPIDAVYFSSDGGGTEDVKNVWGGNHPYLRGVVDPYEETISEKVSYWNYTQTMTGTELNARVQPVIQKKGYNCAMIVDFKITELTPTGNVKTIVFTDVNGKEWPFTQKNASDFRTVLGLKSIRYSVTKSGETTGGVYYTDGGNTLSSMNGVYAIGGDGSVKKLNGNPYVITGSGSQFLPAPEGGTATGDVVYTFRSSGWGHNVGMSQWGAYAMAQQGFTYDQILKFYYTGVEIY